MPRKKKEQPIEVVLDEVVESSVKEVEQQIEQVIIETLEPEKIIPVVEEPKVVTPPKPVLKKITITTGKADIDGLRYPIGVDKTWKEDKVSIKRVKAFSNIEIIIPEECDLGKWVNYYRSLSSLGVKVIKFGRE